MPSFITIELYDKWGDDDKDILKEAMLEHFTECSSQTMGTELERRLANVRNVLEEAGEEHGWNAQTIASLMVQQSAEDEGCRGFPTMAPCVRIFPGSEYVWKIYLGLVDRRYELRCFAGDYSRKRQGVREVDWRTGKKI